MKIYKYELDLGRTTIEVPYGGTIVHWGLQNDTPCLWILVGTHPENFCIKRTFSIVGTGWDIPDNRKHIGTYQDELGLVLHIMEIVG
jgi:hypothetical protein